MVLNISVIADTSEDEKVRGNDQDGGDFTTGSRLSHERLMLFLASVDCHPRDSCCPDRSGHIPAY